MIGQLGRLLAPRDGTLSAFERAVVTALAGRLFRPDGDDFPQPDDVDIAGFVETLTARMDDETRGELALLLFAVEHVLPRMRRQLASFTRLSGASQDDVLVALESSPIAMLRGAFDSLKSLCAVAYFRDARTWGPIGYDGPLRARPDGGWVAAARLGRRAP